MEFWGVEVKAGEPLSVCPDDGQLIHMSQVALGEVKNMKAANYIPIRLKVNGKKFVIGTLSAEREPQITFDLVLEKEFELSHDWKDGSIYFCGYTADEQDDGLVAHDFSDEDDDDEDEEEENILENGKTVSDAQVGKPKSKAVAAKPEDAKPKVTLVEPKKESYGSDESDDIDDESDDDLEDDDMSEDEDDDEDEETPKKVEQSKKRPSDSAIKTPASTKKAKIGTPQKTDGKKGSAHTATPHPSKKSEKKTAETPKSSGSASCKTCSKTFNSEMALESHSKAKHGGK